MFASTQPAQEPQLQQQQQFGQQQAYGQPQAYGQQPAFGQQPPQANNQYNPAQREPVAVQVQDNRPRYPCIECQFHDRPNADHSMVERVGEKGNYKCAECRCELTDDIPRYGCESQFGKIRHGGGEWEPIYCPRRLCMDCMSRSRYLREHSRFNHKEPEWKSSLLCCDGLPGLTLYSFLNYYNCGSPVGPHLNAHELTDTTPGEACCDIVFGAAMCPFALLYDIMGCFVFTMVDTQVQLYEKFGVRPMGFATLCFCRWCADARLKREVQLRGYSQRYPCGPSQAERQAHRPPLPPGVSNMSVYDRPAPPSSAPAAPVMYGMLMMGAPATGQPAGQPMLY